MLVTDETRLLTVVETPNTIIATKMITTISIIPKQIIDGTKYAQKIPPKFLFSVLQIFFTLKDSPISLNKAVFIEANAT